MTLRRPPRRWRRVADINLTPLVDIVLVLLIVFMVTSPPSESQLGLRVPGPDATRIVPVERPPSEQSVLTVKADGTLFLDRREGREEELLTWLDSAFRGHPTKVLFFEAEDGVSYDRAVRLLDMARRAGVDVIGLVVDPARPFH